MIRDAYLKQIFAEISVDYGSTYVSYDTVCRWKKKFDDSGLSQSKMDPNQEGKSLHL